MSKTAAFRQRLKDKKFGPIIGSLIIVLLFIVITLYAFANKLGQQNIVGTQINIGSKNPKIQPITNNADDVESIKADLKKSTPSSN